MLSICGGISKSSVNSMAFPFAPIDIGTDSFSAFAFAFAYTPIKVPQYVYTLFHFLDTFAFFVTFAFLVTFAYFIYAVFGMPFAFAPTPIAPLSDPLCHIRIGIPDTACIEL